MELLEEMFGIFIVCISKCLSRVVIVCLCFFGIISE